MEWGMTLYFLGGIIAILAVGMEVYKKTIRGDGTGKTRASKNEIMLIAFILSLVLVVSFGLGLDFFGNRIALIGYVIGVYILQYVVDMKMVKTLLKWWLDKKGIDFDEHTKNL
ncbi:MAG: hypothetical protein CVV52_04015 [Spirochaetae bacterium HGW-Spirochaetae-8]|jgi:antibiotic biosynthesis monooxygenase (ABM) superfamily enzyme|nr:MAG: hypothetical protein CVV52_04015 [Spirochaetae bacterium HGW-Spirochaetae-8]